MGKVKVKFSQDLILKLLHLTDGSFVCEAKVVDGYIELTFANTNIPEGLYEGHISTYRHIESTLKATRKVG